MPNELTYTKKELLTCYLEEWTLNSLLHREDGPAKIYTFRDGSRWEMWYNKGLRHKEHGPAFISYDEQDKITSAEYYFNDRLLTEDQHKIAVFCKEEDNEL